ncbi:MAG: hypothetical protein ABIW33_06780 [Sphingomicrobium sp.]
MSGIGTRDRLGWGARALIGLVLIIAGAAAATWILAHNQRAASYLGVADPNQTTLSPPAVVAAPARSAIATSPTAAAQSPAVAAKVAQLESRLARVEDATHRTEGSVGRADALVIAFAARRAIDRGIALGYLENLLAERFGHDHQQAIAAIITESHQPVRLDQLNAEYDALGPQLRRGGSSEGWWAGFRRELGSVIEVHRAESPPANAEARFNSARQRLGAGEVDQALAETMRLPGAAGASDWVARARRYIAVHRALDEIESAALLPDPSQSPDIAGSADR